MEVSQTATASTSGCALSDREVREAHLPEPDDPDLDHARTIRRRPFQLREASDRSIGPFDEVPQHFAPDRPARITAQWSCSNRCDLSAGQVAVTTVALPDVVVRWTRVAGVRDDEYRTDNAA